MGESLDAGKETLEVQAALAVIAAAGWHGIGRLPPDARIAALALVAILVALGGVIAMRHDVDAPTDAPPLSAP